MKCILVTAVCVSACVSVCLSLAAFPHYCTDPDVTWGMVGGALYLWVTGQLADTPTHGLPTRGPDKSRTGLLADTANRSICCFNCMIRLCGHNTTNRITSVIYV